MLSKRLLMLEHTQDRHKYFTTAVGTLTIQSKIINIALEELNPFIVCGLNSLPDDMRC